MKTCDINKVLSKETKVVIENNKKILYNGNCLNIPNDIKNLEISKIEANDFNVIYISTEVSR